MSEGGESAAVLNDVRHTVRQEMAATTQLDAFVLAHYGPLCLGVSTTGLEIFNATYAGYSQQSRAHPEYQHHDAFVTAIKSIRSQKEDDWCGDLGEQSLHH